MLKSLIPAAGLALVIAATANAEPVAYTLDRGHAHIGFEVYHLGYSRTAGRFNSFDGTFLIDEEAPGNSAITFTVDTASVDTNHPERDAHLRNGDYLNVDQHPQMHFESTRVEMLTPDSGLLHGELTLLGVRGPLTVEFEITKDAPYPAYLPNYDEVRTVGFEARGTVLRLDHGMDFVGFIGSPTGLAIDFVAYFDLLDCRTAPSTNVPCHYRRD